jgi:hypothetical protein
MEGRSSKARTYAGAFAAVVSGMGRAFCLFRSLFLVLQCWYSLNFLFHCLLRILHHGSVLLKPIQALCLAICTSALSVLHHV